MKRKRRLCGDKADQEELCLPKPERRLVLPEPSFGEQTSIANAAARVRARPRRMELSSLPTRLDTVKLLPPHADRVGFTFQLRDAFGTTSGSFARNQIKHISRIVGSDQGNPDILAVNAVIALVDGIRPENELEAAVALQIGVTHQMAGKMLAMAAGSSHLEHRERYVNLATKLQRTMTAHVDALVKLRANGKASAVGQVTVNDGGQAIVGTVNIEGRRNETEG